jgi:uncharacterized protein
LTERHARSTSLVLMLKAPARSKRRLAAGLGDAAAAEAARRLAACALEDLAAWPGPTWLAPADPGDLDWLGDTAARHAVVQQGKGNLGARIGRVSETLRERGFDAQIFVGIDCPHLDADYLERAADMLAGHDVVLGPASDGGVVLMGTRVRWPALEPLPWSTERLGAVLEAACRRAGSSVAALDPRTDIDTVADFAGLAGTLEHDVRPARRALREWLEQVAADGKGPA